jgi:hypothetical protein
LSFFVYSVGFTHPTRLPGIKRGAGFEGT